MCSGAMMPHCSAPLVLQVSRDKLSCYLLDRNASRWQTSQTTFLYGKSDEMTIRSHLAFIYSESTTNIDQGPASCDSLSSPAVCQCTPCADLSWHQVPSSRRRRLRNRLAASPGKLRGRVSVILGAMIPYFNCPVSCFYPVDMFSE